MPQQLDIIFTMPHPDDVEITCGGTIAKLTKQGHKVGIAHMTNGEPTPNGTPETREKELRAAAEVLGVQHVEVIGLPNRELMDGPVARYAVATVFRRHKPGIIVGMAGRTPGASPDHYQAQLILEAARFYSQLTKWDDRFDGTAPHRIDWLWYRVGTHNPEVQTFQSTFTVDISDVFEQKIDAISCYRSQFDGERLEKLTRRLQAANLIEGGRCGFHYGETFGLPHTMPMTDPVAHFNAIDLSTTAAYRPQGAGPRSQPAE